MLPSATTSIILLFYIVIVLVLLLSSVDDTLCEVMKYTSACLVSAVSILICGIVTCCSILLFCRVFSVPAYHNGSVLEVVAT